MVLRQRFFSQFQQSANIRNNLHTVSPDNTPFPLDKQLLCTVGSYQFQQDYFLTEKKGALFVRYTVLTTLYLRNGKPGRLIFCRQRGYGAVTVRADQPNSFVLSLYWAGNSHDIVGVCYLSRLAEFRAAEKALQEQLAQLEALKNDAGLKKEIEFEQKLQELMGSYGKSLRDIIAILDPGSSTSLVAPTGPKRRRARVVKVYQNPHTGELIETKGGNHRGLKAWKEQCGVDTVDSWLRA